MNRKFRVTLWIREQPFYHFCKTMMEVIDLVETAIGRYLSPEQRGVLIDAMVGMLMKDTDIECSLTSDEKEMRVSLAYVDPTNIASIVA